MKDVGLILLAGAVVAVSVYVLWESEASTNASDSASRADSGADDRQGPAILHLPAPSRPSEGASGPQLSSRPAQRPISQGASISGADAAPTGGARSGPHFRLPATSTTSGPSYAIWARQNVHYYPNSLVAIPGSFPEGVKVTAELIEPNGLVSERVECPMLRVSDELLVALLPTGRPGTARTLELGLAEEETKHDSVEIPIRNLGTSFDLTDAKTQIESFVGPQGGSTLAREVLVSREAGENPQRAAQAPLKHLPRLEELLRIQFAPEDALSEADRANRRKALQILDRTVASTRARLQ